MKYPNDIFRSPVDFGIILSGTFGELRTNHFHSGMDIKTQGATGKNIYAIADGYVSRIKISPFGFGKTLYVNHPQGYTSVYAHLNGLNKGISQFIREEQYRRETFALNIYLEKDKISVKKGEIIAYSGNSGYSFGPHLHFEVREAATQEPINPLLFGFPVADDIRPKIKGLKIYPVGEGSSVDRQSEPLILSVGGGGNYHYLMKKDTIRIKGNISFGIHSFDQLNGAGNKNGIYELALFIDSRLFFKYRMEKFAFSETRYINSLIDYEEFVESKQRYIRTQVDPNNKLRIYEYLVNDGIYSVSDSLFHDFKYVVQDANGNRAELSFKLLCEGSASVNANFAEPEKDVLSWRDNNNVEKDGMRLFVPAYALYDNVVMEFQVTDNHENGYSSVYHVHNRFTPIHKYITLSIKTEDLSVDLRPKALLARLEQKNGKNNPVAAGGEYEDAFVKTKIRDFGKYVIMVDTVTPEIIPLNFKDGSSLYNGKTLKVKIIDDFSGIKTYRGTMNGEWILMEYDAKNDLLLYNIDDRMKKGENLFKLEVTDQKNNKTTLEYTLFFK